MKLQTFKTYQTTEEENRNSCKTGARDGNEPATDLLAK
jgi:hypothetical protein